MTAETLSAIVAIAMSLAFSYLPGLETWYDPLPSNVKRLIMLGALFVVSLGVVGLACTGLAADFGLNLTCDRAGVLALVRAFIAAAVANQTAYKLSPQRHPAG